ncbi:XRE family transcriptional regulator [Hymenobacter sp. H14-R3]|uniref:ImmA/IrrE family metallo-endopeptidase n=1 Tax=Hymenobacter sp. H14-R3 TaxID=3046308 RepID=UPI0024B8C96D|nr:XRE family transcriptional regulator [Hymenobacter sp. H14-R3]MDJ0366103.1 XRE family transcriptional regulator [Hymenobacter sp. H14-R3]
MGTTINEAAGDTSSALMGEVLRLLAASDTPTLASLIEKRREELQLSTKAASEILGMPRSSYERLVTGVLQKLDVLTVYKLAHFLDTRIEDIMQLFAASAMPPEDFKAVEKVKEASFIAKNFDVEKLRKIGFIKSADYEHIKERIIEYFGLSSLYEYGVETAAILFSRARTTVEDKMMKFWILSAYQQFQRINNPHPFNPERVEQLAMQARQYTRKEKTGLLTVMRALDEAGVTVITQRALPNTSVHGATFIVNKKPCIVLTDHFKRYPTLWFTLLHELAHIIFHMDKLATMKFHISDGVEDLFLIEAQADKFAKQLLLSRQKFDYIKNYINIESFVTTYAEQNNIHPSVIYWLYAQELREQNDDSGWRYFSRYITMSDVCPAQLHSAPWLAKSIVEEADKNKALISNPSQI